MAKRITVELEELRVRLREAEETLSAIRNGEVDSLIVSGPNGDQVFTLKGAEQPYRVFVEQMREGAVTVGTDGGILYCNQRFAEMMHSRLEKVIGTPLQSFVRVGDRAGLEQILSDPAGAKVRYALEASDGALISAQLSFCRLPVDEMEAICVVVTDLAEQQEKQELATALADLRAAQGQLQLQNDELNRARQEAEAASAAKDNFLAALSHELRTPLTPVLMTAAALELDPSVPEGARKELSILRRNVELEARLIDDLLDLTRIVQSKIELRMKVVDVHSVVDHTVDICRSDIGEKRLQLVCALRAEEIYVNADPVRVQQIIWNLLRNAVKFTPAGGQIMVRSHNEAGRVCISIADTGIGIEAEVIGRIFNPFEQAGRGITRQFGGLGLGLAISKRLGELLGGTLMAQSDGHNRGSTFILSLPTVSAPVSGNESMGTAASEEGARSLRILLVEDHDDTRHILSRLLGRRHKVRDVSSMGAALAAANREAFDLVISDIGLPDGSGLELMRQLRERYSIKGICLSGFGMEDDIARSAEAGFDHHLTKPIDFHDLETILGSIG